MSSRLGHVFGIGYPKSGTTSLLAAMELLGWPRDRIAFTPEDPAERERFRREVPRTIARNILFGKHPMRGLPYLVAADRVFEEYRALARAYPEAKFVVTYRDPHEIALSAWRHARRQTAAGDSFPEEWVDYEKVLHFATDHYRGVLQFALEDGIRERSVVIRICDGEGWEVLCPFLGLPVPDLPFPTAHRSG